MFYLRKYIFIFEKYFNNFKNILYILDILFLLLHYHKLFFYDCYIALL